MTSNDPGNYRLIRVIESSSENRPWNAGILLVQDRRTCRNVVEKKLTQRVLNSSLATREQDILRMLDHPNIIRLEGAYFSQTKRTGSLFLEYCNGGSLFDLIRRHAQQRRPISELYVWYIFHQIALALEYLHSGAQQVLHLDIKPDNIFLQRDRSHGYGFVPKLADFGMSEVVPSGCPVSEIHYFNARYAPPEGVRVVAKSDVYMLGVTIESLMKLQGAYHGGGYSDELKRSVEACKSRDLRERPSAATLIRILDRRLNRIEPTLRGAERPLLR